MADKPHIFISYRRSDDLTMTGRIYDRLCSIFGEDCVFKDMEDIPAGADFRQVLDNAIASADVVLVIIGQKWLNVTNASGQRRLDEPNDFVRAEIESALNHTEVLLIPTLIDGAVIPGADQLPPSIQDLAYRNAVAVRVDPDFSRDIQALEENIKAHFT